MTDYISREAAIEMLHYNSDESCASVVSDFESIPAADVEPVRHGRLLRTGFDEYFCEWAECSVCRRDNFANAQYCCGCGAKLDGGRKE